MDFHNYTLMAADAKRTGPGEQGASVERTDEEKSDAAYAGNNNTKALITSSVPFIFLFIRKFDL